MIILLRYIIQKICKKIRYKSLQNLYGKNEEPLMILIT